MGRPKIVDKYNKNWEQLDICSSWISRDPSNSLKAYCRYCKSSLTPHSRVIRDHSYSAKHQKILKNLNILSKGENEAVEDRNSKQEDYEKKNSLNNESNCSSVCGINVLSPDQKSDKLLIDETNKLQSATSKNVIELDHSYYRAANNADTEKKQNPDSCCCDAKTKLISEQTCEINLKKNNEAFEYFSLNVPQHNLSNGKNYELDSFEDKLIHDLINETKSCDDESDPLNHIQKDEKYIRQYISKWEKDHDWLESVPDDKCRARCRVCPNKTIVANITNVIRHAQSKNHLWNSKSDEYWDDFDFQKANTEMQLAALIINRYLSFLFVDHLIPYLKAVLYDSQLLQDVNLNRKKVARISENVFAPAHTNYLIPILQTQYFGIHIDEMTDITRIESLCIVVRFTDMTTGEVKEMPWDVIKLHDGDEHCKADAETIGKKIAYSFERYEIPLRHIISCNSDTCNVMHGKSKSVATELKNKIEGILVSKCYCHLGHLSCKSAMEVLPSKFTEIVHLLYNYISRSSLRENRWKVLQIKEGFVPLELLNPVDTRWLSYFSSMLQSYARYTVLTLYFTKEYEDQTASQEQKSAAKVIKDYFDDPINKVYHSFLVIIYAKLYFVTKILQSVKPLIPENNNIIKNLFKELLKLFVDNDHVESTDISDLNPCDHEKWKKLEEITLHPKIKHNLSLVSDKNAQKDFIITYQKFLVALTSQIYNRYEFDNDDIDNLDLFFLNPKNAISKEFHAQHKDLSLLIDKVPALTEYDKTMKDKINKEWADLLEYDIPEYLKKEKMADKWWWQIGKLTCKTESNKLAFENVSIFCLIMLCLPNANAGPERVWSEYGLQKTGLRNRLHFETIRSLLLSNAYIKSHGGLMAFSTTMYMFEQYDRHLRDKTNSTLIFEKPNEYKNTEITHEHRQQCKEDDDFRSEIQKELKKTFEKSFIYKQNTIVTTLSRKVEKSDSVANKDNLFEDHSNFADSDVNNETSVETRVVDEIGSSICTQTSSIIDDANSSQPSRINDFLQMQNGLIPDVTYYDKKLYYQNKKGESIEIDFAIARFIHQSRGCVINLYSSQYHSLNNSNILDGEVINSVLSIYELNWENAIFINTNDTHALFELNWTDVVSSSWDLFQFNFPDKGVIFMPYCKDDHWRILMINLNKHTVTLIDPLDVHKESDTLNKFDIEFHRVIARLDIFILECYNKNIKNSLVNAMENLGQFQMATLFSEIPRPFQENNSSSGHFILFIMNAVGLNNAGVFEKKFIPESFAVELKETILKSSLPVQQLCSICFERKKNIRDIITCQKCNRIFHKKCLKLNNYKIKQICDLCMEYINNPDKRNFLNPKIMIQTEKVATKCIEHDTVNNVNNIDSCSSVNKKKGTKRKALSDLNERSSKKIELDDDVIFDKQYKENLTSDRIKKVQIQTEKVVTKGIEHDAVPNVNNVNNIDGFTRLNKNKGTKRKALTELNERSSKKIELDDDVIFDAQYKEKVTSDRIKKLQKEYDNGVIDFNRVKLSISGKNKFVDVTIDAFMRVMKMQFPRIDTQSVQYLLTLHAVEPITTPTSIQILGGDFIGHWRTAFYNGKEVMVFDSLPRYKGYLYENEMEYITKRFNLTNERVQFVPIQTEQTDGHNCGAFACAYAAKIYEIYDNPQPDETELLTMQLINNPTKLRRFVLNTITNNRLDEIPCFSHSKQLNDRLMIPNNINKEKVIIDILTPELWLEDDAMDFYIKLLMEKYQNIEFQSVLFMSKRVIEAEIITKKTSIQFSNINKNHWRTLYYDGRNVHVYDSLIDSSNLQKHELLYIEYRFNGSLTSENVIKHKMLAYQKDFHSCSLLACAYAQALCDKKDPANIKFNVDSMTLREHLAKDIFNGTVTPFPIL